MRPPLDPRRARPERSPRGRSPGSRLCARPGAASVALSRTFPGLRRVGPPVVSLGIAPRSQWRDRAGFAPASLFGPGHPGQPRGEDPLRAGVSYARRPPLDWRKAGELPRLRGLEGKVRVPATLVCLAAVITACGHPATAPQAAPAPVSLHVRPVDAPTSPSPLVEVQVGDVRGVVPRDWEARTLPGGAFYQEG